MSERTIRASALVERLQALIEEYGDREVFVRDADTDWSMKLDAETGLWEPGLSADTPDAFMISGVGYGANGTNVEGPDPLLAEQK